MKHSSRLTKRPASRTRWTASELSELAEHHCRLGNKWTSISKVFRKTDAQVKNIFYSTSRSKSGFSKCPILHIYAKRVEQCAHDPEARRAALQEARDEAVKARNPGQARQILAIKSEARAPRGTSASSDMHIDGRGVLDGDRSAVLPVTSEGAAAMRSASSRSVSEPDAGSGLTHDGAPLRPSAAGECCHGTAAATLGATAVNGTYRASGCVQLPCTDATEIRANLMDPGQKFPDYAGGGGEESQAAKRRALQYDPSRDPLLLLRQQTCRTSELSAAAHVPPALPADPCCGADAAAVRARVGGCEAADQREPPLLQLSAPAVSGISPAAPSCTLWSPQERSPFTAPVGWEFAPCGAPPAAARCGGELGQWPSVFSSQVTCGGDGGSGGDDLHGGLRPLGGAVSAADVCGLAPPYQREHQQGEQHQPTQKQQLQQLQQLQQQQQQQQPFQKQLQGCGSCVCCELENPLDILVAQLLQHEEGEQGQDEEVGAKDAVAGPEPPYLSFGSGYGGCGGGYGAALTYQGVADDGRARPLATVGAASLREQVGFGVDGYRALSSSGSGRLSGVPALLSSVPSVVSPPAGCHSTASQPDLPTGAVAAAHACTSTAAYSAASSASRGGAAKAATAQLHPPPPPVCWPHANTHAGMTAALVAAPSHSQALAWLSSEAGPALLAPPSLARTVGHSDALHGQAGAPGSQAPAPFMNCSTSFVSDQSLRDCTPAPPPLAAVGSGVEAPAAAASAGSWGSGSFGDLDGRVPVPARCAPLRYAPIPPLLWQQQERQWQQEHHRQQKQQEQQQ